MKRCPHCGVQDHDEAILCKSCMRSFAAPPERSVRSAASQRQGSPIRALLTLLVLGAIGFAVTNPELALELVNQVVDQRSIEPEEAEAAPPEPEAPPAEVSTPPAPPASEPERPAASEPAVATIPAPAERPSPARSPIETAPAPPKAPPRRPDTRPAEPRRAEVPAAETPRPEPAPVDRPATAPPRAPAASAQPVRVGGNIKAPTKVRDVRPVYPAAAQSSRVQGVVIIEATIGPDGNVRDARVLRPIPLLDDAALEAVRQWQYEPTLVNGVPTPVIMTVTVNFRLQ